jgi:hypothetical protein
MMQDTINTQDTTAVHIQTSQNQIQTSHGHEPGKRFIVYHRQPLDMVYYICRHMLYFQALAGACSYGVLMSFLLALVGQQQKTNDHGAWAMAVLGKTLLHGVRIRTEGLEHFDCPRPAVFICNHQNLLDLAML